MKSVLILGGTGDASQLVAKASRISGIKIITSLAGRTQNPLALDGNIRIGGFGGSEGLAEYLRTNKIDILIDATHPYAANISFNAAIAASMYGIPHLMFIRPTWEKLPGDNWIEVDNVEAAAKVLPNFAKRVFLTVGRQQLAPFATLENIWFLMRLIDPPSSDALIPGGEILCSRGPFILEDERSLLKDYQIDTVVSKNSGGDATMGKITAARELNLKVVMVRRPSTPSCEKVDSIDGAMEWLLGIVNRD
jgi:precorrin-6A/cobalt-precorrin-6A reductase